MKIFERLRHICKKPPTAPEPEQPDTRVDPRHCGLTDAVQSGWFLNDSNELFKGFAIGPQDSVLDFGTGAGAATLFSASRGAEVVFIDAVAEKVNSLRQRVAQTPARNARGFVCNNLEIPVEDNRMTRIVAMEVLEHVPEPEKLLQELVRVGQPGALYLLTVPDPVAEKIQQDFAPAYYFEAPNHIHIFEREAFSKLVQDAGLNILHTDSSGFYWSFWMMLYWTQAQHFGTTAHGESHDVVQPPYNSLLHDWAKLWKDIIDMPESAPMKRALDNLLPKSQIIIAQKPF